MARRKARLVALLLNRAGGPRSSRAAGVARTIASDEKRLSRFAWEAIRMLSLLLLAEFWNFIPTVRACCNDLSTYEHHAAVAAYAYVHFLERYRRTILALKYLTSVYALPLGGRGVRTLDVGTGPACSLYAVGDFYEALRAWANEAGVEKLAIPPAELHCIEQSRSMVWFFHRFSEFCERPGPFRAEFNDFRGLDLAESRAWHRRQNEYEEWWNSETEEFEEVYVGTSPTIEALFRYRFVIFSKFLQQIHRYLIPRSRIRSAISRAERWCRCNRAWWNRR